MEDLQFPLEATEFNNEIAFMLILTYCLRNSHVISARF